MNLSMDERNIRDFVIDFFLANGAQLLETSGQVMRFRLTNWLQEALDLEKEEVSLAFPPLGDLSHDVEPVLPGSPLLSTMVELAKKKGKTANLLLVPDEDVENEYERSVARMRFQNAEVSRGDVELIPVPYILFNFVVTFMSDEKREEFRGILVELSTGRIRLDHDIWFNRVNFQDLRSKGIEVEPWKIEEMYTSACQQLACEMEEKAKDFEKEAYGRLAREISRIDAYYETRKREVREGIRTAEERVVEAFYKKRRAEDAEDEVLEEEYNAYRQEVEVLKERAEKDIKTLDDERRRRISEEKDKYSPRSEVRLINSAFVTLLEFHETLTLRTSPVTRKVELIFDLASKELTDVLCDRCGAKLETAYLCGGGHLVCPDCTNICKICGRAMCSDCYMVRCQVCNGLICKACSRRCAACGLITCKEHSHACGECGEEICEECTFVCEVCGENFCGAHVSICSKCGKPVCSEHGEVCIVCGEVFCTDYIVHCCICGSPICRDDARECSVCGEYFCHRHSYICTLCGEVLCAQHVGICDICGQVYCVEHMKKCPGCGIYFCLIHLRRCSWCGQEYCSHCASDDICGVCNGLKGVPRDDPAVQSLIMKWPRAEHFWYWKKGENEAQIHLYAIYFMSTHLFIIDKESKNIKECISSNIMKDIAKFIGQRLSGFSLKNRRSHNS